MMLRRILLGIITASFCFGVFVAPVIPTLSETGTISLAPAVSYAQAQISDGELTCAYGDSVFEGIFCGLVKFFVTITTFVSTLVLAFTGLFMDYAMSFSLASANYSGTINEFIEIGWKIVRDVANILFIFGLVVAAFYLILQPGQDAKDWVGIKSDPKKIVVWVIIMALLVNFSLLFTKIIVDVGNITGRVFYTRISENGNSQTGDYSTGNSATTAIVNLLGVTENSVSLAIVSKSNPQELLLNNENRFANQSGWQLIISYLFVSVMVFAFNIGLIFTFAVVAFLFFARTFGLWIAMVLSPLAFILYAVPLNLFEDFKFESWIKKTSALAFLAPAFLFFIYLAIKFLTLNISFPNAQGQDGNFFGALLIIAIKLIASMFIILKGKGIAENMSGEVGKFIGGVATTVAGFAVGGAVGGTAFLGRQTLGRAGARVAASETLREVRAGNAEGARERLATKFGNFSKSSVAKLGVGKYNLGALADRAAKSTRNTTAFDGVIGGVASRGLARGILAGGRKIDEQTFDARAMGIPGVKGNLASAFASQGADLGEQFQREEGYTEGKKKDADEKKKKLIKESEALLSAEEGPLRKEVEAAEAELDNETNPAVKKAKDLKKDQEKAEDAVKDSPQAKKIEELTEEMTGTTEAFTNYNKAIKEAEQELKDFGAGLSNYEKDTANIATEEATLAAHKAPGSGKTADEIDEQERKVQRMKDYQANASVAKKNIDAAKNDSGYLTLKAERDRIQKEINAQKLDPAYQTLKRDAQAARNALSTYKSTDPDYKAMLDRVKAAEKKFNDAQKKRLESFAKIQEEWIDKATPGNSAWGTRPWNANSKGQYARMGTLGRTYEGFAGSTKGTREAAQAIRKSAKEFGKAVDKFKAKP